MELRYKIVTLVLLQITLIMTSFLVIIHFESQTELSGNLVNVAGKNRLLTSLVQTEIHHAFHDSPDRDRVRGALAMLEENIRHLKSGGEYHGIEIMPIPERFDSDWQAIVQKFEQYAASVRTVASGSAALEDLEAAERVGAELIALSDTLTGDLGRDVSDLSSYLITLQAVLGGANVVMHILMIYIMWRIIRRHTERQIKSEKFAAVGELASLIAHDMRNPLGAMRNSAALIQGSSQDGVIARETERINRSIKRMSHQIEGVLNYVRNPPLVLEPYSVRAILEQSLDAVTIPDTIRLGLPDNDATILCDSEKLEFVFSNIILNAVQAIRDDPGSITVRIYDLDDSVEITFENSGPGITRDDLQRIFEPLFTTRMQGTGLGLTSCRNIIERHGGTITASSGPVTFTIHLPGR